MYFASGCMGFVILKDSPVEVSFCEGVSDTAGLGCMSVVFNLEDDPAVVVIRKAPFKLSSKGPEEDNNRSSSKA